MSTCNVAISAYSDLDPDARRRSLWGDYWFKVRLGRALRRQGLGFDPRRPMVWIHLFGHPMPPPDHVMDRAERSILWIHSHPDLVTAETLGRYDVICSASAVFARRLRNKGVPASHLMVPTHMRRLNVGREFDVVFVGNARHPAKRGAPFVPRPVVRYLLDIRNRLPRGLRVGIWGRGWNNIVPRGWLRGEGFDPGRLNALYSGSRLVLNDHHPDMAREGFLNPRVLDALAAGTQVASDPVAGVDEVLGGGIRVVQDGEGLLREITRLWETPAARIDEKLAHATRAARRFSYAAAARRLSDILAPR